MANEKGVGDARILLQVLECSWAGLVGKVESAEDLDEVIEAHEKFLGKIMCQCLLDPASQPILTRLRAIYDLIIMFQQKQAAMFSAGLSEVDRRRELEETRDARGEQVRVGEMWMTTQLSFCLGWVESD